MDIIGGKEHQAAFMPEGSIGSPPDGVAYKYPGLLKEYKISHGLNITDLTGLASEWVQGWAKEGYNPALSLNIQAAGPDFYDLIEPALTDTLKSQAWEIWKGSGAPGGYKGALAIGAIQKGLTLNKSGLPEPLGLTLDLIAQYIQITDHESGGGSAYTGFKGTASNPLNILHPAPSIIPWLGAHVREVVKIEGAEETPAPLRSWALQIAREVNGYLTPITGADGASYTVPGVFSEQKASAALIFTLGANGWTWWERSYNGEPVDYTDLIFTPPASLSGIASKKIRLIGGIIKPFDLDIKELAALEYPVRIEFKGVELLNA